MKKKVVVIGGGIIGLSCAYYLHKEGYSVTIIDKSDITSGASFVNAGYITPSHIIPLASPGMILKGIKWMFNSASPFYMKPRLDFSFLKWAWYFHKSSTLENVEKAIPVIKDINILSRELYKNIKDSGDLGDFQLERKGLLMLYKTETEKDHELEVAEKARFLGLDVNSLHVNELNNIETSVKMDINGAIHYECDAHMTPNEFMQKMLVYLKNNDVEIITNEEVLDIEKTNGVILEVKTSKRSYLADEFVLATGSWSELVSKKMKLKLPIQAGKGYRIDVKRPTGITIPAILMEAKVAVTPMNGFTRFAGTMEFSGNNNIIRKNRVEAIANAVSSYYPDIKITDSEIEEAKCGLRPVSPDGLPYIGRSKNIKNLTIATGHAMMGWSLGPATGKLISEIIASKKTSLDISVYNPDRFN